MLQNNMHIYYISGITLVYMIEEIIRNKEY